MPDARTDHRQFPPRIERPVDHGPVRSGPRTSRPSSTADGHRVRPALAHRVHDGPVGRGDQHRPALRLGGDQVADHVVGEHAGVAEQHPHARAPPRVGAVDHARPVEDDA